MKKLLLLLLLVVFPLAFAQVHHENVIGCFSMDDDDTSGAISMNAVGTPHGTITGATSGVEGLLAEAYSYDGINDYITINDDTQVNGLSEISMCQFFNVTQTSGNNRELISWEYDTNKYTHMMVLSGRMFYRIVVGGAECGSFYGDGVTLNDWHLACMTYNGSELRGYLDNRTNGTGACSGTTTQDKAITFGATDAGAANDFVGKIDETIIWNHTIHSDDINHIWNAGVGETCPYTAEVTEINYTLVNFDCDNSSTPHVMLLLGFAFLLVLLWMYSFIVKIPLFSIIIGVTMMFYAWVVATCFLLALYLFILLGFIAVFHSLYLMLHDKDGARW